MIDLIYVSVKARVWVRLSLETLACGTGACAIAAVSSLHDYMDSDIDIALPGGSIKIRWNNDNAIYMEGPVKEVFRGVLTR